MKRGVLLVLTFLFFLGEVYGEPNSGIRILDTQCLDTGQVIVTIEGADPVGESFVKDINITYSIRNTTTRYSLKGKWSDRSVRWRKVGDEGTYDGTTATLTTNETIINESGKYIVYAQTPEMEVSRLFTCPGLLFSCVLINLTINHCYFENDIFMMLFTLLGRKQSYEYGAKEINMSQDIKFIFDTDHPYYDRNNFFSDHGSIPYDANIMYKGNDQFQLKWDSLGINVSKVQMILLNFNQCKDQKKYPNLSVSTFKYCGEIPVVEEERNETILPVVNETSIVEEQKKESFSTKGYAFLQKYKVLFIVIFGGLFLIWFIRFNVKNLREIKT